MSQKRTRLPTATEGSGTDVFISDTIEDRDSTFIGYYSPTMSAKTLQATPALKAASHRIVAWRKPSSQKTLGGAQICTVGSDDDGEKYAGKKIEKVLIELKAEGSLVVARWYGGTLLGPVRFTHIENAAKQAIARSRGSTDDQVSKRPKLGVSQDDDESEKRRLIKQLQARDQSILTLRQLLADKQSSSESMNKAGETASAKPCPRSMPLPDYATMSLERLKQLDKARDATIAWILKQIDSAEETSDSVSNQPG